MQNVTKTSSRNIYNIETFFRKQWTHVGFDLRIPFVHDEITLHANKYKLRTTGHSNQLICELFSPIKRRKKTPKNMSRKPS
jgi:hypothetical protein